MASFKNVKRSRTSNIIKIKIDKQGKVFVKALLDDSIVGASQFEFIDTDTQKLETVSVDTIRTNRVIKVLGGTKDSPGFLATENSLHMVANDGNKGFNVIKDVGSFVNGPLVMDAHPESIKIWNVYRLNGDLTSTMPSTIITPIPMLKLDLPFTGIKELKKILSDVKSLMFS